MKETSGNHMISNKQKQNEAVDRLQECGFLTSRIERFDDGVTIFMLRKHRHRTVYADVDPEGKVNGMDVREYLACTL
jgi:hypothetical protein